MKLLLITIAALAIGSITIHAEPATCGSCILTGIVCYSQTCGADCMCIQPKGPGSQGWCN